MLSLFLAAAVVGEFKFEYAVDVSARKMPTYDTLVAPVRVRCRFVNVGSDAVEFDRAAFRVGVVAELSNSACGGHAVSRRYEAEATPSLAKDSFQVSMKCDRSMDDCAVDLFVSIDEQSRSVRPGDSVAFELQLVHLHGAETWYSPLCGELSVAVDEFGALGVVKVEPVTVHSQSVHGHSDVQRLNNGREADKGYTCSDVVRSAPSSFRLSTARSTSLMYFDDLYVRPTVGGRKSFVEVRFWYLMAAGSDSTLQLDCTQVTDRNRGTRVGDRLDFELPAVGHWTEVVRWFEVEPGRNAVRTAVRIKQPSAACDIYVDDVSIRSTSSREPVESTP